MDKFLERGDIINGRLGEAVATIDGQRENMFYLKNITAKIDIDREDIPRLGTTVDLSVGGSAKGTFEADMYSHTKAFRKILIKYMKEGKETPFDIILTQNDPNFEGGSDTVILKRCYLDGGEIFKLDIEDPNLDQQISGTFEDVEER